MPSSFMGRDNVKWAFKTKQSFLLSSSHEIWGENSFVAITIRRLIGELESDAKEPNTLLLAPHFLNFVHYAINHSRGTASLGNWSLMDWNGLISQLLQIIANEKITNIGVLTETVQLLEVIITMQKRPQSFIKFNGLETVFKLIQKITFQPNAFEIWNQSHCLFRAFRYYLIS
ncbi:hypothetical protein RFI_39462 [Reticulomyxa filosa]|uniref:Uncharacterized protein n=1 Tax=Reticulomyxa filosa TaxID=46433 RepID=X6L9M5_RETFI|nr:hypothetical protein RFI_39462 [Reticulomyxa filosa]|eukprot:ETN98060.1 hypothetical protein RFI_39462 [Reticulomyxa filosa]